VTIDKLIREDNRIEFQILNLDTKHRVFGRLTKGSNMGFAKDKISTPFVSYKPETKFYKAVHTALTKLYKGVK
jgi:hypothetical protein